MPVRTPKAIILRRYTELPVVLEVLQNRQLTLLSPLLWDDKNDRASMQSYADSEGHKSVLGICFSQAAETFHHWKVFAPHSSGVCIEFHKNELLALVPNAGYKHRKVKYQRPPEFLAGYPTSRDLPFIKGWAYRHEIEYRIVYASEAKGLQAISFPIEPSSIRSIVLSPWLAKALVEPTRKAINAVAGCEKIPVTHSSVVENEAWIAYVNRGI